MALFGAPIAHEDDPERAIRAALRISGRIPALGLDLHARIGINTGEILYRSEGQGREDAVTGDAANTAARLQGLAPVDGVVVGESTWRATSRAFEYRELPAATVKGKAEPIRVFQPTAPQSRLGIDLSRTTDTPFVGMDTLKAALSALLASLWVEVDVHVPYTAGELLARIRERGTVELEYLARDVRVTGRVAPVLAIELERVAGIWAESLGEANLTATS